MVLIDRSVFLEEWATGRLRSPEKKNPRAKMCDFAEKWGEGDKTSISEKWRGQFPCILIGCDAPAKAPPVHVLLMTMLDAVYFSKNV